MQIGLRFIKQNFPQIKILEFPSWEEFEEIVDCGWDVIGFSFYTFETNEVLRMADHARKKGVPQLWAGNFGALNPLIESVFDKVILGYSEEKITRELRIEIGEVKHPPLIDSIGLKPVGDSLLRHAWLYTVRGCPYRCAFCQTPVFADGIVKTPIESIDRVLHYYKSMGVQFMTIWDENFGIIPEHTRDVLSLFAKYGIPWGVAARADSLVKDFDEWYENGLVSVQFGIESMNPASLNAIRKGEAIEDTLEMLERLNRHQCITIASYMIGFEQDTVDSIEREFRELRRLNPDFLKIFVVTPYPQTPLWDQIQEDYGIDISDWSKFDGKHLVWNHPRLSPEDIQTVMEFGYDLFNSEAYVVRFLDKLRRRILDRKGLPGAHDFLLSSIINRLHGVSERRHFFA